MSLENELARIANALEAIGARLNGDLSVPNIPAMPEPTEAPVVKQRANKQKPATQPVETQLPPEPLPTKDDVTDLVRQVVEIKKAPAALAILQRYGAKKVSDVPVDAYPAIVRELKEAIGG